jgi:hypothetical protein
MADKNPEQISESGSPAGIDPGAIEAFGFLNKVSPAADILKAFKDKKVGVDGAAADHFLEVMFRWVPKNIAAFIRVFVDGQQVVSTSGVGGQKLISIPAGRYRPGGSVKVQTAVTFLNDGWRYRIWARGMDDQGNEVFRGPVTDEIRDPDPESPDDNIDVQEFSIPFGGDQ